MEAMAAMPQVEEQQELRFRYLRDSRWLLIPYVPGVPPYSQEFSEESLAALWRRMKKEEVMPVPFHEHEPELSEWLALCNSPLTRLCAAMEVEENEVADCCGLGWLHDLVSLHEGKVIRAKTGFTFFRAYQKPEYTGPLGRMFLEWAFQAIGCTVLTALTPQPNRAARLYLKRLGLREKATIPGYTTYEGEACAGVLFSLTNDEFGE